MELVFCQLRIVNCPLQKKGGLAQLARAPALQAGGHRFESDILHLVSQLTINSWQLTKSGEGWSACFED